MKIMKSICLSAGLLLIVLNSACQLSTPGTSKATARATTSPLLRKVPTQLVSTPNVTLAENQESGDYIQYFHPSGAFQIQRPAGWEVNTSENGSVFISEPGGEGAISVTVTFTGYALNGDDFVRFVEAREENFFGDYHEYQAYTKNYNDLLNEVSAIKDLLFNEIPETVDSYYVRQAEGIFAIDVWMETINLSEYREMYKPVLDSFEVNADKVEGFPLYNFVTTLYGPVDLYSFEVPVSWQYQNEPLDGVITDRFIAPDGQSIIEHLTVHGIGELSQKAQEQTLVDIFQKVWENPVKNLKVAKRDNFEDGSTYLLWMTDDNPWQIETVYRISNGKMLILNGLIHKGFEEIYQSTIDYAFDWYSVPAAED